MQLKVIKVVMASLFVAALAACGGGGGSTGTTPGASTSPLLTVTGTAATGLAIPGAIVTGKCKVGTGSATTTADGSYALTVTDGQLPCLLQITNPVDGVKLHTVVLGTGSTATANITPLTEMATARMLGSEPNVFFAAFDPAVVAQKITSAAVQAAQTDIGLVLTGTVDTAALGNFLSAPLKAATQASPTTGDAQDKLLDALKLKLSSAQIGALATALASNQATDAIKQMVASMTIAPTPPPVANAGVVQSVVTGTTVTLDASTSSAAAGKSLSYAWTLISVPSGSSATLAAPSTVKPTFVADVAGLYVASVIVNDGSTASSAAAVTITASVANAAPVANAGDAQNVVAGASVTLDGSASSDANADQLTYSWSLTSKPAGSAAALASATSAKPTFTAALAGTYVASLTVNDGKVNSTVTTVTITAAVANVAPMANAGVAQNVVAGTLVTLDGSASSDANGDQLTYSWRLTSKPAGSSAALALATSAKPTFMADATGTYVVSLTVNDGRVNSTAVPVTVTADLPPVPIGAGLLVGSLFNNFFYMVNEVTGAMTELPRFSNCGMVSQGDIAPDGRLIVSSFNINIIGLMDPINGNCRVLFNVPEPMRGLAVAPDGTIVTISEGTTFGKYQVYSYRVDGTLLSKTIMQDDLGARSIDFASDGKLTTGGSTLNPNTGVLSASNQKCTSNWPDIDIDASGQMRTISGDGNYLQVYDCNTGQLIRQTLLQLKVQGVGVVVYR